MIESTDLTPLNQAEYDLVQAVESDDPFLIFPAAARWAAWRTVQPDWGDGDEIDDEVVAAGEIIERVSD